MYTSPENATYYSWKAEPYSRGTSSILTSCFITFTLCVWTAVHLNIPKYNKSAQGTWRKIAWLCTAMLAPELVALAAFCQWREASSLTEHVREVYGQEIEPSWWRLPRTWSGRSQARPSRREVEFGESMRLRYVDLLFWGRFLLRLCILKAQDDARSGFAIDTRGLDLNMFSHSRHRMILSVDGFEFLLDHEPDMLPDLSQTEIFDKSKANNLEKTVVCCQATRFCAQCIARWYSDLAFSLLELNTFAHCVCALVIFVLWLNKPMDVEEPTLINAESIRALVGLMAICSLSRSPREKHATHPRLALSAAPGVQGDLTVFGDMNLWQGQVFEGFKFLGPCQRHDDTSGRLLRRTPPTTRPNHKIILDETARRWWQLARDGVARYGISNASEAGPCQPFLENCTKRMLVDRIGDVPQGETLSRTVVLATLAFAGLLYGGVHLAAWQTKFKTKAEEEIWKISAITLAASGPLGVAVILSEKIYKGDGGMTGPECGLSIVLMLVVPASAILYLVARVYLIVESFLNLAYLEESTFLVPNWLQYMPHIT